MPLLSKKYFSEKSFVFSLLLSLFLFQCFLFFEKKKEQRTHQELAGFFFLGQVLDQEKKSEIARESSEKSKFLSSLSVPPLPEGKKPQSLNHSSSEKVSLSTTKTPPKESIKQSPKKKIKKKKKKKSRSSPLLKKRHKRNPQARAVSKREDRLAWLNILPSSLRHSSSELQTAVYQIALERWHFSSNWIDASPGTLTSRAILSFQKSRGLTPTGTITRETHDMLAYIPEPFIEYTVTKEDFDTLCPKYPTFKKMSKAEYLGYHTINSMLVERFHVSPSFLKELNPNIQYLEPGTKLVVPNVETFIPIPRAESIRVILSERIIEVYDKNKKVIAHFPCAIAKNIEQAPIGDLEVINVAPNSTYTFNPKVLTEAAKKEGITRKIMIPPGPKNPIGIAWIGINKPGYGIHGTPDPTSIGKAVSHGCTRLSNWNIAKLMRMIHVGIPVEFTLER